MCRLDSTDLVDLADCHPHPTQRTFLLGVAIPGFPDVNETIRAVMIGNEGIPDPSPKV